MTAIGRRRSSRSGPGGTRWPLDGRSVLAPVRETGRPVTGRRTQPSRAEIADAAHVAGIRAESGAPIIVDGRVWGAVVAASSRMPLPPDTEGA